MALIKFKSGALGNIEVTTAARPKDLEGSISILGEKGTIIIGGFAANKIDVWEFQNKKLEIKKKIYAEPIQCIWIWSQGILKEVQKLLNKNNATLAIDTIPSLTLLHSIYSSVSMKKS